MPDIVLDLIPVDAIVETDRQRQRYDEAAILDLADSIAEHGLLHPPVVKGSTNELLAGGRRLRAIRLLHAQGRPFRVERVVVPPGMVPVLRAFDRDQLGWRKAELAENADRLDLTWKEKAAAIAAIHKLTGAKGKDLIKRTGTSHTTVTNALAVAEHLDDPDLAKAKSLTQAAKILARKKLAEHRAELAKTFRIATPHEVILGDALEELRKLPPGTFSTVITDPPCSYAAGRRLPGLLFSRTRDDAWAFIFCDIERYFELQNRFASAGWQPFRTPLVWYRGNLDRLASPRLGVRRTYELIAMFTKGDPRALHATHDLLNIPCRTAEKPPELYRRLLEFTTPSGSRVLDPFCGTGPIFPAATAAGCIAVGIDCDPKAVSICKERIAEEEGAA